MIHSFFSLQKSRRVFRQQERLYRRKAKRMDAYTKEKVEEYLEALRGAILENDPSKAKAASVSLTEASMRFMPKSGWEKFRDFIGGMLVALCVAVLIRTMWFELYTIPTGSMRPTLKEEDYLIVSKTDYGINVPLQEAHLYFDESLVQRGSIIVFNGANMDIEDVDTKYFYLFPGKKQFVKRLIGKPGDTLYFYGGDVYGMDREGRPLDLTEVNRIEHIPFIRFDGKVEIGGAKNGVFSPLIFRQMNIPVAKLQAGPMGSVQGELLHHKGSYSDLWGMKHFAMARLLTPSELAKIHPNWKGDAGVLYLELTHHPTLQGAKVMRDDAYRARPDLATSISILPLQMHHIEKIKEHMTTCRFTVKNGIACRQGWNVKEWDKYLPRLPGVPDGTYEIQDGKATKLPFPAIPIFGIFTNGASVALADDHPLYRVDLAQIHTLYNLGFEFMTHYAPLSQNQKASPSRYAYFKNQDLYLMGAPVMLHDDPTLIAFNQRERERESMATTLHPYSAFKDEGAPTLEEIQAHGIKVPEHMYLALGDNHAMSADSRQFGFVPEDNLKGGVSFLFAPPGERWGRPPQAPQPHATFPNLAIWIGFCLAGVATSLYYRRKLARRKGADSN